MNKDFQTKIQNFYEEQYKDGENQGPLWYRLIKPFTKTREESVLDFLKNNNEMLDLGCGEGWLARKATEKFKKVYGIDISKLRIDLAKKAAKQEKIENVYFLVGNVDEKSLPFPDNKFDVVTCVSILQYVFDPLAVFKELKRVIKKDGYLIVEVPNVAYFPERLKLLFGKLPGVPRASGWAGGVLHLFTMSTLGKAIEQSGFKIISRTGSGFLCQFRNWWPSLLTGDLIIVSKKIK